MIRKPAIKRIKPVPEGVIPYDGKTIIVICCLLFAYPLGILLMWLWMATWTVWMKLIISIPILLGILFFIFILFVTQRHM